MIEAASDDLTKPLGVEPLKTTRRFRIPLARVLGLCLAVMIVGIGGWIAVMRDPFGGEPHIVVSIDRSAPAAPDTPAPRPEPEAKTLSLEPHSNAADIEGSSGVSVIRPLGTSAPSSVVIRIPEPVKIKLAAAPDKRLIERSRYGILPRIGSDGAKAASIYARPSPTTLANGSQPTGRVALLVGSLGISQNATAEAIAKLPPAVTLAFAPYGTDLERHVARARDEGHEVMLQVPMEPFDYPDNDPGPHTLTTSAKAQDNLDKLQWVMARFSGYTGLVNFLGAKLTADEATLKPLLKEIGSRGLVFLDDGSSSRSIAAQAGPVVDAPVARADLVLDSTPRVEAIDKELAKLEGFARSRGWAIGTASALPLTVDRLARWAKELETRGILLVPVSAAFGEPRR